MNQAQPLTPVEFDTSDKPSMGDPQVVDALVRQMLDQARKALLAAPEGSDPRASIIGIAHEWRDKLWAGNTDYIQTMTPEAQDVWLKEHGLGERDNDPRAGVGGLVVATLNRFIDAVVPFAEQQIDEEQLKFRLDTAVEDCVCMLLGIENPAD